MVGPNGDHSGLASSRVRTRGTNASASLIVPILEIPSVLELFLSGLHSTIPEGVQLILVDDGCGADSRDVLRRWHRTLSEKLDVSLLSHEQPLGDSVAFNVGAEHAYGDFVARLDSDIIFSGPWFEELIAPFEGRDDIGIISGVLFYPQTGGINHAGLTIHQFVGRHAFLNARPSVLPKEPYAVQTMPLGFSMTRRTLLEAAGGYDQAYHSGYDDLDLALRIADLGGKSLITPHATAFHWERSAGPHRDAARKRNLALFWYRWGGRLVDDLWNFLGPSLNTALGAGQPHADSALLGIDLLGDRIGAASFWAELPRRTSARIQDVRSLAHRCGGNGPIALPLVLGADGHRDPRRMLFLTDNFVRLRANSYFFERRMTVRDDDLVVDMHGNAVLTHELALVAWPGDKVR